MAHKIASIINKTRSYLANDRGVAAVEFAIVLPVFIMLIMGIVDFGRIYWIKSAMQFVVEQSTRYAMVNTSISEAALETYAYAQEASVSGSGATFEATIDASGTVNYMTVTGTYTFSFITPLVGTTLTLDAKSVTPISED
ncbi:MAG: pilus assembly protein [Rhodospirillaceae bacterium]|nr:pilus assembly protein [Rhodospirillaceae bacterium]